MQSEERFAESLLAECPGVAVSLYPLADCTRSWFVARVREGRAELLRSSRGLTSNVLLSRGALQALIGALKQGGLLELQDGEDIGCVLDGESLGVSLRWMSEQRSLGVFCPRGSSALDVIRRVLEAPPWMLRVKALTRSW